MICLGRYPRKSTLSGGRCSAPLWFARTRRFRSQGPGFYRLAKELGFMSKGDDKVVSWKAEFPEGMQLRMEVDPRRSARVMVRS